MTSAPGVVSRSAHLAVPLYELDAKGRVKPNPLFHRPLDYLHSRCVEYPFAASQLGDAQKILDVGTVKSDRNWIAWLESLPIEVHVTDYDEPLVPFGRVRFHRADLRALPFESGTFDKVFAVSVIEHIGLPDPQVNRADKPPVDASGDVEAFEEMLRVVKPGGAVVMTFPFGPVEGIVLGAARNYTEASLQRFNDLARPCRLEYYEYQHAHARMLYAHREKRAGILGRIRRAFAGTENRPAPGTDDAAADLPGLVTWRNIPLSEAAAEHETHIDGVLCGTWIKPESPERPGRAEKKG